MSIEPLALSWALPHPWIAVPLDTGDLEGAVVAALDERAGRDPDVMAAYDELRQMLGDFARGRAEAGAVAALVRWEVVPAGDLVAAYVGVERHRREAGAAVEDELDERQAALEAERDDDHRAPLVERIEAPIGVGVRREGVRRVDPPTATDAAEPTVPDVVRLALGIELWLWLRERPEVLVLELASLQVGEAERIGEELDAIVASLELAGP